MHSLKLQIFLNVKSVNSNIIRKISATSSSVDQDRTHLKSWRKIPGPPTLPLIGQTHHFLPGGSLHNLAVGNIWDKISNQYGPIVKLELAFTPLTILLTDPDSIQQVFHAENNLPRRPGMYTLDYYRRHYKTKHDQSPRHVGLATEYGEQWKSFRSMVNQVFLQPNVVMRYSNTINNVARDMIGRLKSLRNEKNMIHDFDTQVKLWSLESLGLIAMGCKFNCFDQNPRETLHATNLLELVHEIFKDRMQFMDFIMPKIWKYYPTQSYLRAMSIYTDMEQITEHFLRLGMDELNKRKVRDDEKSVLEKLFYKNEDVAIVMACDIILAGFHTVSYTLISLLYLLAVNPDKQHKLRESLTSNDPKIYLRACLKETMRVLPTASSNARILTREHNILGYKVPKNAIVVFYHEKLLSDENQYPRPREFIPERWIVEKEDPLYHGNAHPFASLPFGFGVRSCIGRRIAELELETMLYHVIENFSVEWNGPPPVFKRSYINILEGLSFVLNDVKK